MSATQNGQPSKVSAGAPLHPLDKFWYVHIEGKTSGPHSGHEIRRLVDERKLVASDLVYAQDGSAWTQIANDPIFQQLFNPPVARTEANPLIHKRARRRWPLIAASLLMAVVGWIAWPYYAVYDLAAGLREGNVSILENRVEWTTVRQGLRDDLNAVLLKKLSKDAQGGAGQAGGTLGTGLAVMLGPAIIDRMIDSYVTPQAIATFNRGNKGDLLASQNAALPNNLPQAIEEARHLSWSQVQYAFFASGPFSFKVDFLPEHNPPLKNPITFIFNWSGTWKLARILLTRDAIEEISSPTGLPVPTKNVSNPSAQMATATSSGTPTSSASMTAKEPAPLSVDLLNKGFRDKDIHASIFDAYITITLAVKNSTDKDIRAFDGVITFTDLLDNQIMSSKIAINDLIKTGATFVWDGSIKYNQFTDEHEQLRNARQENIKIKFVLRKILYADGSSKEYSGH